MKRLQAEAAIERRRIEIVELQIRAENGGVNYMPAQMIHPRKQKHAHTSKRTRIVRAHMDARKHYLQAHTAHTHTSQRLLDTAIG